MRFVTQILNGIGCLLLCLPAYTHPLAADRLELISNKTFAEVIQDAEFIITEHNFRIINRLKLGQAIRERGTQDFPLYEIILFCNLSYTEKMLTLAPDFIYHCPYMLSIRESAGRIIVGTRLLPQKPKAHQLNILVKDINALLSHITHYASADEPFLLEEDNAGH